MQACLLELGLLHVAELVHPTHAAELVGGMKEKQCLKHVAETDVKVSGLLLSQL
jgi:hypothetical protein